MHGMIEALEEQQQMPTVQALSFEERMGLIVDRERLYRDNQRRTRLLRDAHLKVGEASIEDINYILNQSALLNGSDPLKFYVIRGQEVLYGNLRIAPRQK